MSNKLIILVLSSCFLRFIKLEVSGQMDTLNLNTYLVF